MNNKPKQNGFTFVELMIAICITAVILIGIVSIVSAAGDATQAARETSEKQAQLRYSMIKLKELISQSRLVCKQRDDYILLWKADNNPQNGRIDVLELAYIDRGTNGDYLKIMEISDCPNWMRDELRNANQQIGKLGSWSMSGVASACDVYYTELIDNCNSVDFTLDNPPPYTQLVTISVVLEENGIFTEYQINASLRNWAGHLLNDSGEIFSYNDDEH